MVRPETVAQAVKLGSKKGFAFLGGGTRLNGPGRSADVTLISLEKLGLSSLGGSPAGFEMGATAVFQSVMDHPETPEPVRAAVAAVVSRTLRNMMTVGGELAGRSSASVLLAVLICLEAEVRLASGRRRVGVEDFLAGDSADLILGVLVPAAGPGRRCGSSVLRRTSHAPSSLIAAAGALGLDPVTAPRIVVGDGAGGMVRLRSVENALEGRPLPDKGTIERAVGAAIAPKPDIHSSAEYKRYMAGVMIADILHGLAGRGGKA